MARLKNFTAIANAVTKARKADPTWLRYKGSILIILTGVVAIVAQLAESPDWQGTNTGVILTGVATVLTFMANRLTKDGITPSMVGRIAAYAPDDTPNKPADGNAVVANTVDPATDYAAYMRSVAPGDGWR